MSEQLAGQVRRRVRCGRETVEHLNIFVADEEFLAGGARYGVQEWLLVLLVDGRGCGTVRRIHLKRDLEISHRRTLSLLPVEDGEPPRGRRTRQDGV